MKTRQLLRTTSTQRVPEWARKRSYSKLPPTGDFLGGLCDLSGAFLFVGVWTRRVVGAKEEVAEVDARDFAPKGVAALLGQFVEVEGFFSQDAFE